MMPTQDALSTSIVTADHRKGQKAVETFRAAYNKANLSEVDAQFLNESAAFTLGLAGLIRKCSIDNRYGNGETLDAIRLISNSDSIRENGFLVAWQETKYPGACGFSLLTRGTSGRVALYADAGRQSEPFNLKGVRNDPPKPYDDFILDHLRQTAELMQIDSAVLIKHIASRRFLWRFLGCVNGQFDKYQHYHPVWHTFWGRLTELSNYIDHIAWISDGDVHEIAKQLHRAAAEGQVIPDR